MLKIVRWYVGSDFRLEWLPVEGSDNKPPEAATSTQAASLTDMLCNYATGLPAVRENKRLRSVLQSSAFRTAFAMLLSKQYDKAPDCEEMQSDDGAPGSKDSHADDDGTMVVVAAAANLLCCICAVVGCRRHGHGASSDPFTGSKPHVSAHIPSSIKNLSDMRCWEELQLESIYFRPTYIRHADGAPL